ncbi:hypothetical protein HYS48_05365 [Candidatus Woesearchaeota archaeon]|nr:hypothetical protein [Candidatus Woesearchaeota archaeon]
MKPNTPYILWILLGILFLPASAAIILDDADMLSAAMEEKIEQFNGVSEITFSIITIPSTYNLTQQASENYDFYDLEFLLFYAKNKDAAMLVMPVHEGIPEILAAGLLDKYQGKYQQNFDGFVEEILDALQYWEKEKKVGKPACALLKDGFCDLQCAEQDLDCLCGDGICQSYENSITCRKDCGEMQPTFLCGILTDGFCDPSCPFFDMDCKIQAEDAVLQEKASFQLYLLLSAGLLCILLSFILFLRKKGFKGKKGLSFHIVDTIIWMALLFAGALYLSFIIPKFFAIGMETQELRAELFLQRVLQDPHGIIYLDPLTNKPYPGIIDMEKFQQGYLEHSFVASQNDILAAELRLNSQKQYVHELAFKEWKKMVAAGAGVLFEKEIPVVVASQGGFTRATLHATIITPRG